MNAMTPVQAVVAAIGITGIAIGFLLIIGIAIYDAIETIRVRRRDRL